ncbi:Ran guanyl-nucleotide exchange factor KNAG_0F02230 [Huiozyma naganishii CBS 8797]|uniref:RCC1-like domain-containing protein n=1 Tax=Huiozyma naganishii (strain ATCC MYA-139 / BCRC 22969 / CBS 8797 / KCTC 17520 / NBRC 10181 / NCYC 3082 / Yp74L-3) TaxID=1071383 RepID=J7R7P0_HUIN7|nr:hypothetical protein KNAG_0F02230 [Kazachstania naganishii CBS 8797]CCK70890.1 hypothetical protein KNAG_0F02230 [Kazachstania naganishii CBS 8797]
MAKRTGSGGTADGHVEKKAARPMSKTHARAIVNSVDDHKHLYVSVKPLDIFCWGTGSMCELGLGPLAKNKEVKRPRLNSFLEGAEIVSFAVGGMHTVAVDAKGGVWTWGCNDVCALGRDTSGAKEMLKDMDDADADDDDDGDLNELESTPTKLDSSLFQPLAEGHKVAQVVATDNLTCILFTNGAVYAWGTFRSNEGILGFYKEDIKIQSTPWEIPIFSKFKIVQMAGGKDHVIFLDEAGVVFTWGNGQQYQLGRKVMDRYKERTLDPRPIGLKHVKYVATGENHCFALKTDGTLVSWGLNQFGQCGVSREIRDGGLVTKPTRVISLPPDRKIKCVTGGEHHSIFVMDDGSMYTCGRLDMCEVGISKETAPEPNRYTDEHGRIRALPVPTQLPSDIKYKTATAGSHHSVAVSRDGKMYSWGFAETYAVGLGPNEDDDVEVPTAIENTATRDVEIVFVGCGGQFSVAGGIAKRSA